jgi:hypothetical protein
MNGNEFHAGAGDVITADLSQVVGNTQTFTLTGVSVVGAGETLTQTAHPTLANTFDLHADGEAAGRLFLSDAIDGTPFATTGKFAFAPSVADDLTFDSDGNSHGFQGTIQVDFTADINGTPTAQTAELVIGADYSTRTDQAVSGVDQVSLANDTENQLRLEQRLAFLGFPDTEGDLPDIDGLPDSFTESALRLFQSATDSTDATDPNDRRLLPVDPNTLGLDTNTFAQASGNLDGLTTAWLNHPDAPHWQQLVDPTVQPDPGNGVNFDAMLIPDPFEFLPQPDPITGVRTGTTPATETYSSSWVSDAIQAAASAVDDMMNGNALIIAGLSEQDGESSADSRDATFAGRLNTSGMGLDIDVSAFALPNGVGDGNVADDPAETFIAAFLFELKSQVANFGPSPGIQIDEIVTTNIDIVQHLNMVFGTTIATTAKSKTGTLHVSFSAPGLATALIAEHAAGFTALGTALGNLGTALETNRELATALPLLGPIVDNGPLATLGSVLELGSLFQNEIATPISNYFAGTTTPTLIGLTGLIEALQTSGFPITNLSVTTDSHDQAVLRFTYKQTKSEQRPIDLGSGFADAGLLLDNSPTVNLSATVDLDISLGVDLSQGSTPAQAAFLQVHRFDITGDVTNVNFTTPGRVGFLDPNAPPIDIGPVSVTVSASNGSLDDLVDDINMALGMPLTNAGLSSAVQAVRIGSRIRFETVGLGRTTDLRFLKNTVSQPTNNSGLSELNFTETQFGVPLLDVDFNAGMEVGIVGMNNAVSNGQLTGDATFTVEIEPPEFMTPAFLSVTVTQLATSDNLTIDDLAADLTIALRAAAMSSSLSSTPEVLRAVREPNTNRIRIETVGLGRDTKLTLLTPNPTAQSELGFPAEPMGTQGTLIGRPIIRAGWRDESGKPLVEQFKVSGLGGDDEIGFVAGANAVDFGSLSIRSRDWVGVINGGSGDDILNGSNARDLIDGGRDNDLMYGNAGDDRIFGDSGNGASGNLDVFFAGAGNDDLVSGTGSNRLYAWSFDPTGPLHFNASANPESATDTLTAFARQSRSGKIARDANFSLRINGGMWVPVSLEASTTDNNVKLDDGDAMTDGDLVTDLQNALDTAGLSGIVTAGVDTQDRLTLTSVVQGATIEIQGDQFGVFVDSSTGLLVDNDGNVDPMNPTTPFELEDTGLNRQLGSEATGGDKLYGGTGLDFLYGRGENDELYTRDGLLFEAGFDVPAGEEWKAYAKATNKVWYYGGTGADDVINVDYVTEPGLLSDHHLITRLTNNNGNFTFDAQVRLDFSATDENKNLIWDSRDVVETFTSILELDDDQQPFELQKFANSGDFLPGEGDFLAIIIDALGGNDIVNVGPTVQKTVWVDGGAGDDQILFASGNTILVDRTEDKNRNEVFGAELTDSSRAFPLFGPTRMIATIAGPTNGQLSMPARLDISLDGGATSTRVVVAKDATNSTFADLVADINSALTNAGVSQVVAESISVGLQTRLSLRPMSVGQDVSLTLVSINDIAQDELGFSDGQSVTAENIAASTTFTDLTIDNPADVDWYKLNVVNTPGANAEVRLTSASVSDRLEVALFSVDDNGAIVEELKNTPSMTTIGADLTERILIGDGLLPDDGQIAADLQFTLRITQGQTTTSLLVDLFAVDTDDNLDAGALALSVQNAIDDAAQMLMFKLVPQAHSINGHLAIERPDDASITGFEIEFSGNTDAEKQAAADLLGFGNLQTLGTASNLFPLDRIGRFARITGGTIHSPSDSDEFLFSLDTEDVNSGAGQVSLVLTDSTATLTVQLRNFDGSLIEQRNVGGLAPQMTAIVTFDLSTLAAGDYRLHVAQTDPSDMNATPTGFDITTSGQFDRIGVLDLHGVGRPNLLLGGNDSLLFSSLISPFDNLGKLETISNLTFNIGDAGDWYLIPAPAAVESFGASDRAVFSHDDITVTFDKPSDQDLFMAPDPNDPMQTIWDGDNFSLFAGVQTDPNAELSFLPVEQFNGVPEFYLIHVNNVKSYGIRGSEAPSLANLSSSINILFNLTIDGVTSTIVTVALDPTTDTDTNKILAKIQSGIDNATLNSMPLNQFVFASQDQSLEFLVLSLKKTGEVKINTLFNSPLERLGFENQQTNRGAVDPMGSYSVSFNPSVGDVLDIDAADADLQISSAFPTDKAVLIPLGNIDGDANNRGDFIASVRDVVATRAQIDATPVFAHPHQVVGSSFARVQLNNVGAIADPSGDGTSDITLGANTLTLKLPAPLLTSSAGVQSHITSGDFDADGKSDIAVLVTTDRSFAPMSPIHPATGLYILYGRDVWCADPTAPCVIDVVEEADVIFTNIGDPTSIVGSGDIIGTGGFDDLLIGQRGPDGLLVPGGPRNSTPWSGSRVLFSADFEDTGNPLTDL